MRSSTRCSSAGPDRGRRKPRLPDLSDSNEITRRKGEHLQLAADGDVETRSSAGWEDVHIVHDALPSIDAAGVDLSARFLGRTLALPLVISGMTGGHTRALALNELLARVAERRRIAIGVGSQRAALRDPSLAPTYSIVRETAPSAFVIANVGMAQLVRQDSEQPLGREEITRAIRMVRADAIALHLNYLEESVQPEGQTRATGSAVALRRFVRQAKVPVIAKETGAGITRSVARRLKNMGVKAIDVGGVGGTSFAAIESMRADRRSDSLRRDLGERFREWGIPTAVAVAGSYAAGLPVIATGGVRSGLDAAKALALGATLVGVGRPLLQAALEGEDALEGWITAFELELRTAVFLSGQRSAAALPRAKVVVTGRTLAWLDQLGYRRRLARTS